MGSRVRWAVLAAGALVVAGTTGAAAQEGGAVDVVDVAFEPANLTVEAGTTVTWTQTGSLPHTVTADDGSFDSHPDCPGDCMGAGDTFSMTFDTPGEIPYFCKIHGGPGGVGMAGVITVQAAGGDTDEGDTGGEEQPTVTGSLSVSDQTGDGSAVVVDEASISGANGFVVIHADQDGAPGPVIGHVAIPEGTSTGLSVPLDQPLSSTATVWPMVHFDAGTLGTYEFPGPDGPVVVDGNVLTAPLTLTVAGAAPPETVSEPELPRTGVDTLPLLLGGGLALLLGAWLVTRRSRQGT